MDMGCVKTTPGHGYGLHEDALTDSGVRVPYEDNCFRSARQTNQSEDILCPKNIAETVKAE